MLSLILAATVAVAPMVQEEQDKFGYAAYVQGLCAEYIEPDTLVLFGAKLTAIARDNGFNGAFLYESFKAGLEDSKVKKIKYEDCKAELPEAFKHIEEIKLSK